MNPSQPPATTLVQLRDALAAKRVSAVDVARAYLDRIARHDGQTKAYLQVFPEAAFARAKDVDDGKVTGPLAGVPVAIKDNLCTKQGRTTCASRMLERYVSPFDATAVERLLKAGAVVLGKTNLDEFAMGSTTENSAKGPSRNPWDLSRTPGGSSGGSAAAVAADLCAGALGSDTGGSIRQPAALTGIVGLKPTYGRVSRWGLVAFASSLDQVGPMGHSVADVALMLSVIAGRDPLDSTCDPRESQDFLATLEQPIRGLRVGMAKQHRGAANDPAVTAAVERSAAALRAQGAELVEIDLPHSEYAVPVYYIVAPAEASSNLARYDGIHYGHRAASADDLMDLYAKSRAEGFGPEVQRRIMLGAYVLSSGYYDAYYVRALQVRRLIRQDYDAAFERCDVILAPTTTGPAERLGSHRDDPLAVYLNDIYTVSANLAGIPALSLPAGFAQVEGQRLPVGVQLLGPMFSEERLLRAGRMLEMGLGPEAVGRPAM